jgi:hypothetical protein
MQLLSTYNDNLGTAVLLLGPPGGGKTVLGCRLFPKTYVLVADMNFASGVRYLAKINETENVVGFDTVAIDETGKKLGPQEWYPRMFKLLDIATKDPNIGAIFIDSATFVADYIIAKIAMCSDPANIRMPADKDESDSIFKYTIALSGQIAQKLPNMFSDVWRCEVEESGQTVKYKVRLLGNIRHELKNNFGWTEVSLDSDEVVKRVRATLKPQTK